MKKLGSVFTLLVAALLFTACSSDKPEDLPVTLNASTSQSFPLIAAAGSSQSPQVTFRLDNFTAVTEYVKYIEQAEVLSTSYIEVTGLTSTDEVELTAVSLALASDTSKHISLPLITSNQRFNADTSTRLSFMQNIMDEINRRGSSKVVLQFTSTGNILNEDAHLTIHLNTRFSFE